MKEDVDPGELIDCVLNIAISEKKNKGEIWMNVDAQLLNKESKMTKYHVTIPQKI